jgi:hypothetical protein
MESMGFPTPQPPKEYHQRYAESLTRISLSLLVGLLSRLLSFSLLWGFAVWAVVYLFAVIVLYSLKIPKIFSVGHEIQLFFQHFCALFLIYVLLDNAISAFAK